MRKRDVTPISPDDVNALLDRPEVDLDIPEALEGQALGMFDRMAKEMGEEKFFEFGIQFLLSVEPHLRRELPEGSVALRLLDEYHASKAF